LRYNGFKDWTTFCQCRELPAGRAAHGYYAAAALRRADGGRDGGGRLRSAPALAGSINDVKIGGYTYD
jgi:hypothetical protein